MAGEVCEGAIGLHGAVSATCRLYDVLLMKERKAMGWDPTVLRKYNTTGHFRLLNQLRSELRGNPLIRPKDGETVGAANRSRSLTRALQSRGQGGVAGRSRRPIQSTAAAPAVALPAASASPAVPVTANDSMASTQEGGNALSFRERLNAIEMR
jgi:hypothetical protein